MGISYIGNIQNCVSISESDSGSGLYGADIRCGLSDFWKVFDYSLDGDLRERDLAHECQEFLLMLL